MKFKKFFVFCLALAFPFTIVGREKMVSSQIDGIKDKTTQVIRRAVNQSFGDTEDPDEVFSRAIDAYKDEFKDYLDVTALNVQDKEAVNLPDFDVDYVAPEFYDVMYDYQTKLEASLTPLQLERYELLRKQDYSFDRYVTLNSIKFSNLNPSLKYIHDVKPVNPTLPITPVNPTLPGGGSSTTRVAAVATAEIIGILEGAGLAQKIINAFTACISTMTTGLSTSWIPFVGWALAVALITGALIALVVIIVKNWDKIKTAINDIKAWFLEQFSRFASLIESFFADAIAQGNESIISSTLELDGKIFTFSEVKTTDVAATVAIANQCRRKKDVLLIKSINAKGMQIDLVNSVNVDYCIKHQTHLNGYSSYTWYQNTARELILKAGSGYTSATPQLHLYNKNKPDNHSPKYAFKHFHNYDAAGNRIEKPKDVRKVHSFFGLLYWTENDDGVGTVHPDSPKN